MQFLRNWHPTSWPSMTDYGKSIDSLMKDPEFRAVYVRFGELVDLQERYLMMSYDLDS